MSSITSGMSSRHYSAPLITPSNALTTVAVTALLGLSVYLGFSTLWAGCGVTGGMGLLIGGAKKVSTRAEPTQPVQSTRRKVKRISTPPSEESVRDFMQKYMGVSLDSFPKPSSSYLTRLPTDAPSFVHPDPSSSETLPTGAPTFKNNFTHLLRELAAQMRPPLGKAHPDPTSLITLPTLAPTFKNNFTHLNT